MIVMDGNRECVEFSKVTASKEDLDKLITNIVDAKNGTEAFNAIDKLKKTAKKTTPNREKIIDAIMKYSEQTQFTHLRSLVIPSINEIVEENENQYADFYKAKIVHGDKKKRKLS